MPQRPLSESLDGADPSVQLLGESPAMQRLNRLIAQAARVDAPVLIGGESGCGKELVAQAICRASSRCRAPLVAVNCGAIAPTLAQSELFGHVRGAFTGADRDHTGLIEAADGGTVFLDEVGDLSLELQTSLLRVLQEQTLLRVGSTRAIRINVRVLAATHVDLERAVAQGRFREDLFYRLNVLSLQVPPLRERGQDIALLADMSYRRYASERAPQLEGFSPSSRLAMQDHHWPGNVRELINRVRRAMVMAEGRWITPRDLGLDEEPSTVRRATLLADGADDHARDGLLAVRREAERDAVLQCLHQSRRNVSEAARRLGVSRMTLYRLMARHGISP